MVLVLCNIVVNCVFLNIYTILIFDIELVQAGLGNRVELG